VLFPLDEKSASRRSGPSKRVRRKGHHANSLLIMAHNVQLQCRGEREGRLRQIDPPQADGALCEERVGRQEGRRLKISGLS